jgi:hypothetical protein
MDEPRLALYAQRSYRPSLTIKDVPGEWCYEEGWPVARVSEEAWYPQPNESLTRDREADVVRHLDYKATVGVSNRYRCPHNAAELPTDQRTDDAYSLAFTSAPLRQDVEILGNPRAVLHVSASVPVANWIVRLCDVAPDGSSALVSKGILNGTHRNSHEHPEFLHPGQIYELHINLKVISWTFPRGHRIRLAITNADFPNLWPSPFRMTTTLHVHAEHPSRLLLPVCAPGERPVPHFRQPEPVEVEGLPWRALPVDQWQVTRDEMQQTVTVFRETRHPGSQIPSERAPISAAGFERRWCTASDVEPAKAKLVAEGERKVQRGDDTLAVQTWMSIESDETTLHLNAKRELSVNGVVKYSKSWAESIPRDGV